MRLHCRSAGSAGRKRWRRPSSSCWATGSSPGQSWQSTAAVALYDSEALASEVPFKLQLRRVDLRALPGLIAVLVMPVLVADPGENSTLMAGDHLTYVEQ